MANTYITFRDGPVHYQKADDEIHYKNSTEARGNPEVSQAWESMVKAWRSLKDGTLQVKETKNITDECRAVSGQFEFRGKPHSVTIFEDIPKEGEKSVRAVQITNREETQSTYFKNSSITNRWTHSTRLYLKV